MTDEMIDKCIEAGMKRWTKGNYDRLYINADVLGIEYYTYKTGNICRAYLNGEKISNRRAIEYISAKTYIDVQSGKLYGTNDFMLELAEEMLENLYGCAE